MEGIQQGRLWAIRNGPDSPIFHAVSTNLPALFRTLKDANAFKKRLNAEYEVVVEVVEIDIIKKEDRHVSGMDKIGV